MRLLAALATLLLVVGFATGASAHAALVAVEPASGSMLANAPKAVELRFNEAVTPGAIRLIDGAGRTRDDARVSASGEIVSVVMPPDLPQGTAVVSYRAAVLDGVAEVENDLGALASARERAQTLARAAAALSKADAATVTLRDAGLADDVDRAAATDAYLKAELDAADAETQRDLAFIALYKALGGAPLPSEEPQP